MKTSKLLGIPVIATVVGIFVPLIAAGPVGAAITTTTQVTTASGSEKFSVGNVPPKIWIAKGLTQLNGSALASNTVSPYSYYEFEILVEDDNTLWNSRVVICFHNTSHATAYDGGGFSGTSDTPTKAWNDCVTGNPTASTAIAASDYSTAAGWNKANPGGASADSSSTSQGESWRKARWVLKQKNDATKAYGVDPTASTIVNNTTNNGTWRLGGDLAGSEPGSEANAACDHATRTVGGVAMTTRWDSTLVHLKCSVRIGTLARATSGAADWDLFAAVVDSGNAQSSSASDASYMNGNGNLYAYCSGLSASGGVSGYGYTSGAPNGYGSCVDANYSAFSPFKVATNLSIGSIEGHDFGTLLPPSQTVGATASSTGTDPNPAPPTAANTTVSCKSDNATASDAKTCVYFSHKVDSLVANTDHWKFQTKTSASDGSSTCNDATNSKIAPALGYNTSTSYTCWYATTNPVDNTLGADTGRSQNQTFAVALWEPSSTTAEWDASTMQPNQFAFRCAAFPRDANEASSVTRALNVPSQTTARSTAVNASVYVTKTFADVPLFQYSSGATHLLDSSSGASNVPATSVSSFDGMGSDNTSAESSRIWRRLDAGATPYTAYLHCRLDTSYVRAGTYTGIVYLAIASA
ncbi:MAG: hypothetical protein ACOYN3_05225 [Acidimicrobiia bacterium]